MFDKDAALYEREAGVGQIAQWVSFVKTKYADLVGQFGLKRSTPKAFTNSSPGLLQPWVCMASRKER